MLRCCSVRVNVNSLNVSNSFLRSHWNLVVEDLQQVRTRVT